MNNTRRHTLRNINNQLAEILHRLEEVKDDEEGYRDNMPENLQGSERFEKSDEACDSLTEALDQLEEVMNSIENAVE